MFVCVCVCGASTTTSNKYRYKPKFIFETMIHRALTKAMGKKVNRIRNFSVYFFLSLFFLVIFFFLLRLPYMCVNVYFARFFFHCCGCCCQSRWTQSLICILNSSFAYTIATNRPTRSTNQTASQCTVKKKNLPFEMKTNDKEKQRASKRTGGRKRTKKKTTTTTNKISKHIIESFIHKANYGDLLTSTVYFDDISLKLHSANTSWAQ